MTDPGRFRWLVLATAVAGAMTFCVAEPAPGLALLVLAAAGASAAMTRGPRPRSAPRLALNILVLTATLWALLNALGGRANELISTLSIFLVHILVIKLFDRRSARDEAQLLGLSVFVTIGATLTSATLLLGLTIMAFTPLAIASFIALTLASGRERMEQRQRAAGVPAVESLGTPLVGRRRRHLALVSAGCLVLSLTLSVVAFVVTPRNLVPNLSSSWADRAGMAQTGFSDSIELGRGGTISESSRQVMEVSLLDASGGPDARVVPATLYLRGAVLDTYDPGAGTWRRSPLTDDRAERAVELGADQMGLLSPPRGAMGDAGPSARSLRGLRVVVRNQRPSGPLFALYRPVRVVLDSPGRVTMSGTGTLALERGGPPATLTYSVWSSEQQVEPPPPDSRRPGPPGGGEYRFESGPIRELALSLLSQAEVSARPEQREPGEARRAVVAFMRHLQRTCSYTLENPPVREGADPIESFLFETRRGHCEYFASALAAMCLSVDIPVRVVTGYAAGEFSGVSGGFTVRESDAHAWVEVAFTPGRWEVVDPTPPDRLPHAQRQTGGLLGFLRQVYEYLEFSWFDNVVAFETRRPAQTLVGGRDAMNPGGPALRALRDLFSGITERLRGLIPADGVGRFVGIFVLVGGLVGAGWLLYSGGKWLALRLARWNGRRRQTGPPRLPGQAGEWTRYYAQMLDLLREHGLAKPDATPPLDFASGLDASAGVPGLGSDVRELTRRYYAIRFGGRQPEPDHDGAVAARMDSLRSALRRRATRAGGGPAAPAAEHAQA